MLSLNIQSLKSHHDQLNCFVKNFQKQPSLIALSETWLNKNDNLGMYTLKGYEIVVESRTGKKTGGGVAFLVKSEINFERVQEPIKTSFEKSTIKTEKENKTSYLQLVTDHQTRVLKNSLQSLKSFYNIHPVTRIITFLVTST